MVGIVILLVFVFGVFLGASVITFIVAVGDLNEDRYYEQLTKEACNLLEENAKLNKKKLSAFEWLEVIKSKVPEE